MWLALGGDVSFIVGVIMVRVIISSGIKNQLGPNYFHKRMALLKWPIIVVTNNSILYLPKK
jgi:hypothetical protein